MGGSTIAAIATPLAAGGIGIVRISGEDAITIADSIFKAKRGVKLSEIAGYTAAYGQIYAGEQLIDEGIALVFRAPKSYTGEDVVELSCHSGVAIMRKVLKAAICAGACIAQAGEFTKRAFLNGRIDLTRAEAVMELISAKGEQAAAAAIAQHEGALFRRISTIKAKLFDISADICAFVDYPEEDIPDLSAPVLEKKLIEIDSELEKCIETYDKGRILREGIDTVIVGKPNVGKSTLMNLLAGSEKSIVTEIPGTTRDLVEETVLFAGNTLRLTDTAGIRETGDTIEKIGVSRAQAKLNTAELVFAVFDASKSLDQEDKVLLESLRNKRVIAVLNKSDLRREIDEEYIISKNTHTVYISAKTGDGIEKLEELTSGLLENGTLDTDSGIIANERQLACVKSAKDGVAAALSAQRDGITLDAVSTGIEQAVSQLSALTGERATEKIIERVFEKFCVGK